MNKLMTKIELRKAEIKNKIKEIIFEMDKMSVTPETIQNEIERLEESRRKLS